MSIKIQCPKCGERTGVNERLAGRRTRCPGCDTEIAVPSLDEIEAAKRKSRERKAEKALASAETLAWAAAIPVAKSVATDQGQQSGPQEDVGFEELPIGNRKKREETEMDMTPMVDVTFLLLIFFMVTASFSLQRSIPLPPQKSDAPSSQQQDEPEDELDMVTLQVNELGGYLVIAAEWEREVAGKLSLVNTLRESKLSLPGEVRLSIECHEEAQLQMLVDAMDAGTICEFSELQVTHVDGF
jgi:biopolymer transport protein ExbD